jgi:pimeloyl-ACP methyl ester carboxylesterase
MIVDERALARKLVDTLGGRFSTQAGIDVDAGRYEVERWFLAATLLGTRISAAIAMRTYRVLHDAGVSTIADAGRRSWEDLVALLDAGGYARYDFRTASRLGDLSVVVAQRHPDGVAAMGVRHTDPTDLMTTLDELPGWGPVTVRAFLRELRGVWPAAMPPVDPRAREAAHHLRLIEQPESLTIELLDELAAATGIDVRDLEAGLIRLSLEHRRTYARCTSSPATPCVHLADGPAPRGGRSGDTGRHASLSALSVRE